MSKRGDREERGILGLRTGPHASAWGMRCMCSGMSGFPRSPASWTSSGTSASRIPTAPEPTRGSVWLAKAAVQGRVFVTRTDPRAGDLAGRLGRAVPGSRPRSVKSSRKRWPSTLPTCLPHILRRRQGSSRSIPWFDRLTSGSSSAAPSIRRAGSRPNEFPSSLPAPRLAPGKAARQAGGRSSRSDISILRLARSTRSLRIDPESVEGSRSGGGEWLDSARHRFLNRFPGQFGRPLSERHNE